MRFTYVNSVIIFALGILAGRMSVAFFLITNDISNTKNTVSVVVQPPLLPKNSNDIVDGNDHIQPESSTVLVELTPERLRVISIDESQQHNDWQNILYETADIDLKLTAISNLVSDDAPEKLAIGLGDNSPVIRKETLIGLGAINSEKSIRMIGQTLFSDHSIENRLVAISILERNFDMPFVEHLLTFTMNHDQDASVRQRAAKSLGRE